MTDFSYILDSMKKRTPEESRKTLQDAGILDDNGELHERYRRSENEDAEQVVGVSDFYEVIDKHLQGKIAVKTRLALAKDLAALVNEMMGV